MGFIWEYAVEAHRVTVQVENQTSPPAAIAADGIALGEANEGSPLRVKFERAQTKSLSVTTGEYVVAFDDEDGLEVDAVHITIGVESRIDDQ